MSHGNAPLSVEGRRRLVERCRRRPIAHVAAEMGISRWCASKWVNRYRRFGELGLLDRPSTPHSSPAATPPEVIAQIESWRRRGVAGNATIASQSRWSSTTWCVLRSVPPGWAVDASIVTTPFVGSVKNKMSARLEPTALNS
jgi:hypothetical protein